jgi:hypothetical protein
MGMLPQHWVALLVALLIGYAVGVKFPSYGNKVGL